MSGYRVDYVTCGNLSVPINATYKCVTVGAFFKIYNPKRHGSFYVVSIAFEPPVENKTHQSLCRAASSVLTLILNQKFQSKRKRLRNFNCVQSKQSYRSFKAKKISRYFSKKGHFSNASARHYSLSRTRAVSSLAWQIVYLGPKEVFTTKDTQK